MKFTGACLCGNVTFEIIGNFEHFYLCHCGRCRKDTGSAHASNLFSSTAKLKWLSGESHIKTFNYKSEGHVKSFCQNCGSALPNIQMDGKLLVVPAGSIDNDADINIRPEGHIYMKSKASWDVHLEEVAMFLELPSDKKKEV